MQLDRNKNSDGTGKYALVLLRKLNENTDPKVTEAMDILNQADLIDWGDSENKEFFVMRLKDKCAAVALFAYANEAVRYDQEYATQVAQLGMKALTHPGKRFPD